LLALRDVLFLPGMITDPRLATTPHSNRAR
jgi:hypothetical protein